MNITEAATELFLILEMLDKELEKAKRRAIEDQIGSSFVEILLVKKGILKLKMYQETGHGPHIHVDYGPENHAASYSLKNGDRLEGKEHGGYDKLIAGWILKHNDLLQEMWAKLQAGEDTKLVLAKIKRTKL